MTTTPDEAAPDEQDTDATSTPEGAGAEIGITEDGGSTFEPEEEAQDENGEAT